MSTTMITETTTPPRTRWAAIIWGTLFAAVAASALWLLSDADRRTTVADGLLGLTPTTVVTIALLSVGVLLLVSGAAGLVRRAQRRFASASIPQGAAVAPQHDAADPLAE